MTPPAVLTIAESDPCADAGIQADLKTFSALNCYGTSVITALTAHNPGAFGVHPCPPDFVKNQLKFVIDNTEVLAIKTGRLYDKTTVQAIVSILTDHYEKKIPALVCDPIFEPTSGHGLPVEGFLTDGILPLTTLITPNKSQAEFILSHKGKKAEISNLAGMISTSKELLVLGPKAVLLKGGQVKVTMEEVHELLKENPAISLYKYGLLEDDMNILKVELSEEDRDPPLVADVLQVSCGSEEKVETSIFIRPRVGPAGTHGESCTLSAAIACGLAKGLTISEAVREGTIYTHLGVLHAFHVGGDHDPLNHTHSVLSRCVPRPCLGDKYPLTRALIYSSGSIWKEYVQHPFVKELGKGKLDKRCFVHFIKQDYHYLRYYARALALMAAKSTKFSDIAAAIQGVQGTMQEVTKTHMEFCAKWGVDEKELEATPESTATTAYGAYIMDVGFQSDTIKLNMSLAACLLGYGEVGLWLIAESKRPNSWVVMDEELNPYVPWILIYSGKSYQSAVKTGLATMEGIESITPITGKRYEELDEIWTKCVRLEKGFWDMAMALS